MIEHGGSWEFPAGGPTFKESAKWVAQSALWFKGAITLPPEAKLNNREDRGMYNESKNQCNLLQCHRYN
jgi:hypothetical protein